MLKIMETMLLDCPEELKVKVEKLAEKNGMTPEEFAIHAMTEVVESAAQLEYLQNRAKGADDEKFKATLSKVPDCEPEEWDKMPNLN